MCVFQVEIEGWVRLWENPNGIPSVEVSWLKEDIERGLHPSTYVQGHHWRTQKEGITGLLKRRQVIKSDRMWFCGLWVDGQTTHLWLDNGFNGACHFHALRSLTPHKVTGTLWRWPFERNGQWLCNGSTLQQQHTLL